MYTINDISEWLVNNKIEHIISGNYDQSFITYCPLNSPKANSITWVRHAESLNVQKLEEIGNIILLAEYGESINSLSIPVIYVKNVHATFFKMLRFFFADEDPDNIVPNIASSAVVETSTYGNNLYVGHLTYIGPNVVIGDNVVIRNNVTIQGKVVIGDGTIIESGTTIGAVGFGYGNNDDGTKFCVPHLGGVIIGKNVLIGANNAISRGCLGDTIIEDNVKTDNLCHIAHNDRIKEGAMLTANTVISGSTTVGRNVWTAPGTLLNDQIEVGDNSFLGLGTVATKSLPGDKIIAGVPARVLRERE